MNTQPSFPPVFRRKILFTFILGFAFLLIAGAVFLLSQDHVLLYLSVLLFGASIYKGWQLYRTAVCGSYETVIGLCTGIAELPFRKHKRITLLREDGTEISLLLDKNVRLRLQVPYCFYFRKTAGSCFKQDSLNLLLSTDNLLGYEETDNFLPEKPAQRDIP